MSLKNIKENNGGMKLSTNMVYVDVSVSIFSVLFLISRISPLLDMPIRCIDESNHRMPLFMKEPKGVK